MESVMAAGNWLIIGSAVTCGAFGYSGYIRIWDPRSKEVVWETNEPGSGRSSRFGDSFADIVVDTDDSILFKICSKSGDLAMADVRKLGDDPWVFVGKDGGLEVWSRQNGPYETVTPLEISDTEDRRPRVSFKRNYVDKAEDAERGMIKRIEGGERDCL
ncbi:putative ribosomal RNA methyltransferase [Hibiscus syriacus]|uniref:Ribosomal RNA methyltransferase n=1 Tax=Hibiscus syriacus TaxID=106335 RepID=A0A6A3C728_HIBSY|nr:putative ribosomal RNA methyltransferase [Hibiscus syriacus]